MFFKSYDGQRRQILDNVSKGFTSSQSLNTFGRNCELVHGWMHYAIGGNEEKQGAEGHMWPVDYSAFEPLFMLLHRCYHGISAFFSLALIVLQQRGPSFRVVASSPT